MFCSNCGQQLPDGSKFCNKCGHPVASVPEPTTQAAVPDGESSASAAHATSEKKLKILIACVSGLALICLITLIAVLVSRSGNKSNETTVLPEDSTASDSSEYNAGAETGSVAFNPDKPGRLKPIGGEPSDIDPAPTNAPVPTDEPEPTDIPEPTDETESPSDDEEMTADEIAQFISTVNTDDFPEFETFEWFTEDILPDLTEAYESGENMSDVIRKMHGDGVILKDVNMWNGGWMALIVWDPADVYNGKACARELYNFNIATDGDKSSLKIRSYKMYDPANDTFTDTSDSEEAYRTGTVKDSMLDFDEMQIIYSWYRSSRQYAFGVASLDNGVDGFIVLQRP